MHAVSLLPCPLRRWHKMWPGSMGGDGRAIYVFSIEANIYSKFRSWGKIFQVSKSGYTFHIFPPANILRDLCNRHLQLSHAVPSTIMDPGMVFLARSSVTMHCWIHWRRELNGIIACGSSTPWPQVIQVSRMSSVSALDWSLFAPRTRFLCWHSSYMILI
jgi:hypothetical protein